MAEEGGGKNKLVLIIVAVVLLIVIGAVAFSCSLVGKRKREKFQKKSYQ